MSSVTFAGLSILITILTYFYFKYTKSRKLVLVDKYFDGPRKWPFVGNILYLISKKDLIEILVEASREYPRLRVWVGEGVLLNISKADDMEALLKSNNINKPGHYETMSPFLGNGLILLRGDKWKAKRKLANPGFQSQLLDNYLEIFESNAGIFIDKLKNHVNKGTFNIHEVTTPLALDNICETALGTQINAQSNPDNSTSHDIDAVAKMFVDQNLKPWLKSPIILRISSRGKRFLKALENLDAFITDTIKKRRDAWASEEIDAGGIHDDFNKRRQLIFLDFLIDSGLPDEDIKPEVKTFLAAGYDTTAAAIAFTFYCLSQNLKCQEKVYEEQIEIMGDSNLPATTADLNKMKYLDRFFKEVMRVYPVAGFFGRRVEEDVKLKDGAIIPKGLDVWMIVNALHMDPEVWDQPEEFNPDRFLPEAVASRHPYAYLPFAAGARNCIGKGFAQFEVKSIVSRGVRNFKFLPCEEKDKVNLEWKVVLSSSNGINVRIQERIKN